jgi:hypothetical protein
MSVCHGDIVRMTNFTHVTPNARITIGVGNKKKVAVFMLLGEENKDGSDPLNLEKRLNDLGWVRDPSLSPTERDHG